MKTKISPTITLPSSETSALFTEERIKRSTPLIRCSPWNSRTVNVPVRDASGVQERDHQPYGQKNLEGRYRTGFLHSNGYFSHIRPKDSLDPIHEELSALYKETFDTNKTLDTLNLLRAEFLKRCVETGKTIVIAGETGSGKTTFMKTLMQHIPTDQRIITIEDVPELLYGLPKHENQVNLFYPSEATDKSTVTAASLMRSCLRMKPDRILLAELRGGETFDFLNVCLSGIQVQLQAATPEAADRFLTIWRSKFFSLQRDASCLMRLFSSFCIRSLT